MSSSYPCSVVLAAHGSLSSESVNRGVFALAEKIQQTEIFSTVTPAFLNGQPQLSQVFAELPPGDVIVLPLMASEGYYSQTVFPGKIADNKNLENYRTFLTPAIGVHPQIAHLVADRIDAFTATLGMIAEQTTLILVGHGTPRHPNSSQSTHQLAARLRELRPGLKIEVGFIDQEPSLPTVAAGISTPHQLVIPFLISCGPHATDDVPMAFGLVGGTDCEFPLVDVNETGITVCDLPIGLYPEMVELCLEWATDALLTGSLYQYPN